MDAEVFALQSHRSAGRTLDKEVRRGEDIVVLKLASGPPLMLHPDSARDLLAAGITVARDGGATGDNVVSVSSSPPWSQDGATRGGDGWTPGVVLEWFGILRSKPGRVLAERGAGWIRQHFDNTERQGLYRLTADAPPENVDPAERIDQLPLPADPDAPILILVHGTFSSTAGTFEAVDGQAGREYDPGRLQGRRLRLRAPDAGRQPGRKRPAPGRRLARRRARPPAHALARRTGGGSPGARRQRAAGRRADR
jgi:hypothetical protein